MYKEDYILKTIRIIIRTLAKILFGSEVVDYKADVDKTPVDYLHLDLLALINQGKINEAEDLLFKNLDCNDVEYMKMGLDFYDRLNTMDEDELEDADFSRVEVLDGLKDLSEIYGLNIWKK